MKSFLKTSVLSLMIVALATAAIPVVAGEGHDHGKAKKEGTWTGWITDETCGEKNANADGKACTLKCHENGAKLVLYVKSEKKAIALDNQEEALKNVGHPVTVTGTLEEGVIKVQKIEKKG